MNGIISTQNSLKVRHAQSLSNKYYEYTVACICYCRINAICCSRRLTCIIWTRW